MPATKPLIQPNAQNEYKVDASDLPLACPMPEMYLWNSHPRVYLPIEADRLGEVPVLRRRVPSSALTRPLNRRRSGGVHQPNGLSSDGGGVENQMGFSAPMWKQSSSRMPNFPGR